MLGGRYKAEIDKECELGNKECDFIPTMGIRSSRTPIAGSNVWGAAGTDPLRRFLHWVRLYSVAERYVLDGRERNINVHLRLTNIKRASRHGTTAEYLIGTCLIRQVMAWPGVSERMSRSLFVAEHGSRPGVVSHLYEADCTLRFNALSLQFR